MKPLSYPRHHIGIVITSIALSCLGATLVWQKLAPLNPQPTTVELNSPFDPLEHSLGNRHAGATVTLPLPHSVEIQLAYCPPGRFLMGSPVSELFRGSFEGQIPVFLSQGFWMARTECTQAQWLALMDDNPSIFFGTELPVENVSYHDTLRYVADLNSTVSLPPGWEWSLPTEAQWEYACRAGTATPFSHGEVLTSDLANFDGRYPYRAKLFSGGYLRQTTPVAMYAANAWNMFDMHGNVAEWTLDSWSRYSPLIGGSDPFTVMGNERVIRGGSWQGDGQDCRSANRRGRDPELASATIGFRVAIVQTTP